MLSEDLGDALADFTRKIAERLGKLPARITDDVESQEMLQLRVDRILSRVAAVIEATVTVHKP